MWGDGFSHDRRRIERDLTKPRQTKGHKRDMSAHVGRIGGIVGGAKAGKVRNNQYTIPTQVTHSNKESRPILVSSHRRSQGHHATTTTTILFCHTAKSNKIRTWRSCHDSVLTIPSTLTRCKLVKTPVRGPWGDGKRAWWWSTSMRKREKCWRQLRCPRVVEAEKNLAHLTGNTTA